MFAVGMLHEKYSLCKGNPVDGIPDSLMSQSLAYLRQSKVPASYHAEYLPWLRYYLDFCNKYSVPDSKAERVRLFCLRLKAMIKHLSKSNVQPTLCLCTFRWLNMARVKESV